MKFIFEVPIEKEEINLFDIKERLEGNFSQKSIDQIDDFVLNQYLENYNKDKTSFCRSIETKFKVKVEEIRDNFLYVDLSGIIPDEINFNNLNENEQNEYINIISKSWSNFIEPELIHKTQIYPKMDNDLFIEKVTIDGLLRIEEPDYDNENSFEF